MRAARERHSSGSRRDRDGTEGEGREDKRERRDGRLGSSSSSSDGWEDEVATGPRAIDEWVGSVTDRRLDATLARRSSPVLRSI